MAPGDEFVAGFGIANQLDGSGEDVPVDVTVIPTDALTLLDGATQTLPIDEGAEGRGRVRLKALDRLGPASLTLQARHGDTLVQRQVSLSVRPAVAYESSVTSGRSRDDPATLRFPRTLYPQLAEQRLAASASPLILSDGLLDYLQGFPHACAEQLVSRVFPQVGLLGHGDARVDAAAVRGDFTALITALRARQLPDGGFAFWLGDARPAAFPSVYILHFLADAAEQQLPVPRAMREAGLDFLQQLAGRAVESLPDARLRAYAIYVLTRHEVVTTGHATDLHEWLDTHHAEVWRQDIAGSYLAATYALLKQNNLAAPLIRRYRFGAGDETDRDFDTLLGRDAQHLYLSARHFPERTAALGTDVWQHLIEPVMEGRFNTLSAAFAVLALGANSRHLAENGDLPAISLFDASATGALPLASAPFARAAASGNSAWRLSGGGGRDVFYTLSQRGFDRTPPARAEYRGLELQRTYLDASGAAVSRASVGDDLTVRLRVRAIDRPRSNVAITDLLPGGFEVQRDSVSRRVGGWQADYIDVREDRVVIYGNIDTRVTELRYRVKAIGEGRFAAPAAVAAAMYDRSLYARSEPGTFEVTTAGAASR